MIRIYIRILKLVLPISDQLKGAFQDIKLIVNIHVSIPYAFLSFLWRKQELKDDRHKDDSFAELMLQVMFRLHCFLLSFVQEEKANGIEAHLLICLRFKSLQS